MPDEGGVVFSPETFAEHDGALSYARRLSRTRGPLGRRKRYPSIIPAAWGLLSAGGTITAASGLTLGSGTVKLCDREGAVAEEAEGIDVANAGGELTGGTSGAIVPLEWTDGEWSTCGCVEGAPPTGIFCGQPCEACGPVVYFAPGEDGTVTDDTGTHPLLFEGGGFWNDIGGEPQVMYGTAPIPWTATVASTDPDTFECVVESGTVYYGWGISCLGLEGGGAAMVVWFSGIGGIRCGPDEACISYYSKTFGPPGTLGELTNMFQGSSDPTCDGTAMTAVSSGWVRPDFDPPANFCHNADPWPITAATFAIPLEVPGDKVCCNSCGLPKSDLLLTIGTGSPHTMDFDPDTETWRWASGATVVTLSCSGGFATLTGMGPPLSCLLVAVACKPVHLEFLCGGVHYFVDAP
jgi:hypothetical protein